VIRAAVLLLAALALVCLFPTPLQAQGKAVKLDREWKGYFPDNRDVPLMREAPKSGYITNEAEWSKLWKAWKGKEELPKVDFQKELVFAYAAGGPNTILISLRIDDQGNLTAKFSATEKGGPGFVYRIVTVKRDGVKTINGNVLGK
jgi:hypothetical protein